MLVHEGAGGTDCATMDDDPTSDFGSIIAGIDGDVDAIVSGHTHLEYNCDFTVQDWVDEGRKVTKRPVVSAGQYGAALNQIVFDVNPGTGEVLAKRQAVLKLKVANGGPFNYPVDAPTQVIVDAAVANANVLGAQPLGQLADGFRRAKFDQRHLGEPWWRVDARQPGRGGPALGHPQPGVGLGADRLHEPRVVCVPTWSGHHRRDGVPEDAHLPAGRQRPAVRQHAGEHGPDRCADQGDAGAAVAAAPVRLVRSCGSARPRASRSPTTRPSRRAPGSPGMWLDGTPIDLGTTYSVTVNSFLASGGDNFTALRRAAPTSRTPARPTCRRWSTTWREFADTTPLAGRLRPARRRGQLPGRRAGVVRRGRPREVRPVLAVHDRPADQRDSHGDGQAGEHDVWGPSR